MKKKKKERLGFFEQWCPICEEEKIKLSEFECKFCRVFHIR